MSERREKKNGRHTAAARTLALRLETIGQVASVLNHESHNLLGALDTCSQLLKRNTDLRADDLELLDILRAGARRLREIIAEFAFFRRDMTYHTSPVNLHELIETTLNSLSQDERWSPDLVVQCQFDPGLPIISADYERLRHLFWQLLLNAAQAQGKSGSIIVATARKEAAVCITVMDQGKGIPKHVRPKIFEPLFTTKTRAAGLGLTVVQRVAEDHGGAVSVSSSAKTGTRFVITLPIASRQTENRVRSAGARARSKHGS